MAGEVPIRESVGAALGFVRGAFSFIGVVAVVGALATLAVTGAVLVVPVLALFANLGTSLVQACVYGAFVAAALMGASSVRERWVSDGLRVWLAMAIIGFFLVIVFFVLTFVVAIVLSIGPMAAYAPDLQIAGSDEAAVMEVMTRFARENPLAILVTVLVYAGVWLWLTSRLYLAAPATVEAKRILTFETWTWTNGSVLRITAARLMLLVPANILVGAIGYLAGQPFGLNSLDPAGSASAASGNPAGFMIYVAVTTLITFALYAPLEAGLSSYLYKGLRPPAPVAPPAATPGAS
jgi:hypothetical protein